MRRHNRPLTLMSIMLGSTILLQRFAIPFGHNQIPLVLVVEIVCVGLLLLDRSLVWNRQRTSLYLAAIGACAAAATASLLWAGQSASSFSLLLLFVLYTPFCFSVTPGLRKHHIDLVDLFSRIMLVVAVIAIAQSLAQIAGWRYHDLLTVVPHNFRLSGYNTFYPVRYRSSLMKANGVVMLEPSFLSQFLALAFICDVVTGRKRWRLPVYLAGILTTVTGTGVLLLGFGLIVLVLRRWNKRTFMILLLIAVAAVVTLQTPVGKLYALRSSGEASSTDSSFNGRFQVPYKRTYNDLSVHNNYLAVGRGPGYAERDAVAYFDKTGVPINYPTIAKLVYEYGIVAAGIFLFFLVFALVAGTPSFLLAISLLFLELVLSGGLLQAHTVALCYVLTSMFAVEGQGRLVARPVWTYRRFPRPAG